MWTIKFSKDNILIQFQNNSKVLNYLLLQKTMQFRTHLMELFHAKSSKKTINGVEILKNMFLDT